MRLNLPLLLLGSVLAGLSQAQTWSINSNRTLVWNNEPYVPVGLRIDASVASIDAASKAGVQDVIVEVPAGGQGWPAAIEALEARKMRYFLAIQSLAPSALGWAVEPSGYRVNAVTSRKDVLARLPGGLQALAVLALRSDGSIAKHEPVPMEDGWFRYAAVPPIELEHVLLIYPQMRSPQQPDYWEAFDEHRDRMLTALRASKPGAGLRGIINPMGQLAGVPSTSTGFVPSSKFFQMELAQFLQEKYKNLTTAFRSWNMTSSHIEKWDELARLVPLSAGTRGLNFLWDPVTNQTIACDLRRSSAWSDIQEVMALAAGRRYQRLSTALRAVVKVPIIQDWNGWAPLYERTDPAMDGIGVKTSGSAPSEISRTAARAASTVVRWPKSGLLMATEVDPAAAGDLAAVLEDLDSLGVRGAFVRAANPGVIAAVASAIQGRPAASTLASYSVNPIFFPENAYNPAVPQRLPGGRWWLPAPFSGDRVDFGPPYHAYRYEDPKQGSTFVIWRTDAPTKVKLRTSVEPKTVNILPVDGIDPKAKLARDGLELVVGTSPLVITGTAEIPVPSDAYEQLLLRHEGVKKTLETMKINFNEDAFQFRETQNSFSTNPGGAWVTLRKIDRRLAYTLSDYLWIEAEGSRNHTFSEVLAVPGASNGNVLNLKTELGRQTQSYFAEFDVPVRTTAQQEVWVSARISPDQRADLKFKIGDQELGLSGEPVSLYGNGFGWYKLGETKLAGATMKLRLEVSSMRGSEIAIDTVLLIPRNFRPNGVFPPEPPPPPPGTKLPKG